MGADLRAAIRTLTASRTFTAAAVVVLALGIGVTAAVYTIIDGVLLRRLPFAEAERLVAVKELRPPQPLDEGPPVLPQNFLDWDARQDVFDALAALAMGRVTVVEPNAPPEDLFLHRVTSDFFDVMTFVPVLGRRFDATSEVEGRHAVIVLAHGVWQRRYGGARDVIGRTITLDRVPHEIIGVLGPEAAYSGGAGRSADGFVPLVLVAADTVRIPGRSASFLTTVGRLKRGVSLEAAQARMDQISAALRREHPSWNENHHVLVLPLLADVVNREWHAWLWMAFGAAAAVLAIACLNIAMLQMTRAAMRTHELSIRAALGGGRWRLARLLLVENLVLVGLGALAAGGVAVAGVALLKTSIPVGLPRLDEVQVDLRVLAVMAGAAALTGIGIGLAPALQMSTPRLALGLKAATRIVAGGGSPRLRQTLVVAELSLTLMLLVATALFARSFNAATSIPLGFEPSGVLRATVTAPPRPQASGGAVTASPPASPAPADASTDDAALGAIVDGVAALPGVVAAAYAKPGGPLGGATFQVDIEIHGAVLPDNPSVIVRRVTPGYHRVLRIALLEGRLLTDDDERRAAPVLVVSESMVRRFFAGRRALGETIGVGGVPHLVVGVVRDARQTVEGLLIPEIHAPLGAGGNGLRGISGQLLVRAEGDPAALAPAVARVAARVLPDLPLRAIGTLDDSVDAALAWRRFETSLVGLFGGLGLAIAAIGLYGTVAYGVERRTREIGVRVALGATPAAVVRLVTSQVGRLLVLGVGLGAIGAWWMSAAVEPYLFAVSARDPWSLVAAVVVLSLAAGLASLHPARRATRVDPVEALRAE